MTTRRKEKCAINFINIMTNIQSTNKSSYKMWLKSVLVQPKRHITCIMKHQHYIITHIHRHQLNIRKLVSNSLRKWIPTLWIILQFSRNQHLELNHRTFQSNIYVNKPKYQKMSKQSNLITHWTKIWCTLPKYIYIYKF